METNIPRRRRKLSGGEAFSFPSTLEDENTEDTFEFESCLTPDSPASSTADHLFFNGKLLPHSFPLRHRSSFSTTTSSSLLSSRSNSSNSSNSSSARTSDASVDRRRSPSPPIILRRQFSGVSAQVYGSSQRWRFMPAAGGPIVSVALSRDGSRRRSSRKSGGDRTPEKKAKKSSKRRRKWRIGRRVLRWFVSACKECHAIEPRPRKL